MNLRIKKNVLRIRLEQTDLEKIRISGFITETFEINAGITFKLSILRNNIVSFNASSFEEVGSHIILNLCDNDYNKLIDVDLGSEEIQIGNYKLEVDIWKKRQG